MATSIPYCQTIHLDASTRKSGAQIFNFIVEHWDLRLRRLTRRSSRRATRPQLTTCSTPNRPLPATPRATLAASVTILPISMASPTFSAVAPKAMVGYIIYLNGTPITWSSRKLKITPQSSAEAETAAACNACKAMTYIRNILATLGLTVDTPIEVVTDNEALRLSVRQPGVTQRTRHYESWMQYCRELQLRLVIDMIWTSTENMIADALTKALDKTKFIKFRSQMVTDVREGATSEARE